MGTAPHGTSVAGLIGAEIDNGEGGVGVAWGTSITGVNIFSPGTYGYVNAADDRPFLHVVHQAIDLFDIMSNSWGSFPLYDLLYQNPTNPLSDAARLNDVYSELEEEGRGGPGVIINQAAGNDRVDANGSGVSALMLEANPGLGSRDVQDILATSASYTGPMDGSGTYEVDDWGFNNGTSVNGGGQHINGSYGYGIVNACNSVRNAEVWSLFGAAETSANERMVGSDRLDLGGVTVPDGSTTGHTFTLDVSEDLEIDTVMLNLNTVPTISAIS